MPLFTPKNSPEKPIKLNNGHITAPQKPPSTYTHISNTNPSTFISLKEKSNMKPSKPNLIQKITLTLQKRKRKVINRSTSPSIIIARTVTTSKDKNKLKDMTVENNKWKEITMITGGTIIPIQKG